MNSVKIYRLISTLKASKKDMRCSSCYAIELIRATGYENIIDILLLPLYYTWEYFKCGTLNEVCFEDYLKNSYTRFCRYQKEYTLHIISILKKTITVRGLSLTSLNLTKALIDTYSDLVLTPHKPL